MQVEITISNTTDKNYPIYIDEPNHIDYACKIAIITNPKVAGLHLGTLLNTISAKEIFIITLPDGEEYKNQKSIDTILENLFNHKFNRKDKLIAFGGGVIGDMTGYAASIYQRGIEFIQVPTTLLAQVDSSVGGKTGINCSYGKNLIGAFHQPIAVHINSDFLKTLQKREFGAGFAEIVKMAVTFDKEFFEWLKSADLTKKENLRLAISKSVQTKADVVEQDEKEKGIRAVLNYGHTFAHVIENLSSYSTYLHGEAVSIGMCMANRLSVRLGLMSQGDADEIESVLLKYGLPVSYEIYDANTFYQHFFMDKKAEGEKIKFILACSIGSHKMSDDIEKELVLGILREYEK